MSDDVMMDMVKKGREIVDKAMVNGSASHEPKDILKMIGVALAPRLNPAELAYHAAMRSAGKAFTDQEKIVMQRELPRLRGMIQRNYQMTEAMVARMSNAEVIANTFAMFANSRNDEGGEGMELHVGIRRPFERLLQMFQGLQAVGNRKGFYKPGNIFGLAYGDRAALQKLGPNEPGEELRPAP